MKSADLLFLPMHDLHPGTRAGLIPYKTYEYMGARRPILAAVPDGDVRDMLGPLEHASLVRPSDVEGMAAVLRDRLAHTGTGVRVPTEALRAFERRQCVARIAQVLDSVLVGGVVRAHRAA
jgi:hypothetical protein